MTTHVKQAAAGPSPSAPPASKTDLKTLPMKEVEKELDSSADGLTQAEAAKRLSTYGPNEIVEHKTNPLLKFLSYFWGPIPWMIEVAVILSGAVGHWPDFFIILVLLLANAVVGYVEERQAGNAIDALKAKLAINARVRRDGEWTTPAARDLVPGDVIRLRLGDVVPADARLLEATRSRWTSPRSPGSRCRPRARPAIQCIPDRSFVGERSVPQSTPLAPTPISARPLNWSRIAGAALESGGCSVAVYWTSARWAMHSEGATRGSRRLAVRGARISASTPCISPRWIEQTTSRCSRATSRKGQCRSAIVRWLSCWASSGRKPMLVSMARS